MPGFPGVVNTVGVASLEETVAAAAANGGEVIEARIPVPGIGLLAYLKDTEGNVFAALQPDPAFRRLLTGETVFVANPGEERTGADQRCHYPDLPLQYLCDRSQTRKGWSTQRASFNLKPDANCLNWVIGHILANRNVALTHLAQPAFWDQATIDRYQTGSHPVTPASEDVLSLETLVSDLATSRATASDSTARSSRGPFAAACG